MARVGVRLWQPLANQSLNDLPPNQAPDGRGQSYFIDLLIYSFLPPGSSFLQIDLEAFHPEI